MDGTMINCICVFMKKMVIPVNSAHASQFCSSMNHFQNFEESSNNIRQIWGNHTLGQEGCLFKEISYGNQKLLRKAQKSAWRKGFCMFVFGRGGLERQVVLVLLFHICWCCFFCLLFGRQPVLRALIIKNEMVKITNTFGQVAFACFSFSEGERDASSGKLLVLLESIMFIISLICPSVCFLEGDLF